MTERMRWPGTDIAILSVGVLMLTCLTAYGHRATLLPSVVTFGTPWGVAVTVVVALGLAVVTWITPSTRVPLFVAAVVLLATQSMWAPLVAVSYVVGSTVARRTQLIVFAAVAVGLTVAVNFALAVADPFAAVGGGLLFLGSALVVGMLVRARREVLLGLREHAAELERTQAARLERARIAERTRIAREMHDVVAHKVSLMVLHAGGLEVNLVDRPLAAEAALIRTTGREALTQLREVLGVLRSDSPDDIESQPTLANLDDLFGRLESFGLRLETRIEGEKRELSEAVERTVYRIVQEALTNVTKHAGAVRATVVIRYSPSTVDVTVANDAPTGSVEAPPSGGFGLVGLRERISLLGGELCTERRFDGGFRLHAVVSG